MTSTPPPLTEKQFQRQVTELAELLGWEWVHFRPAQTEKGWRTPVSGPLGKGWVDLILVRERDRQMMFVELKSEGGKVSADQRQVHEVLYSIRGYWLEGDPPEGARISVWVWYPSDWDAIENLLR